MVDFGNMRDDAQRYEEDAEEMRDKFKNRQDDEGQQDTQPGQSDQPNQQ